MTAALGPSYLPYIVKEMKDLLTRGYQVWLNVFPSSVQCPHMRTPAPLLTHYSVPQIDLLSICIHHYTCNYVARAKVCDR